jgi:bleomycin hydrolase
MARQSLFFTLLSVFLSFFACRSGAPSGDSSAGKRDAPRKDGDESAVLKRIVEIQRSAGEKADEDVSTRYETKFRDPVIEEIRKADEALNEARDEKTSEIRKRQKDKKEKDRLERQVLASSLPKDKRPTSIEQFEVVLPHRPPTPQYYTGTCWSFAATSLMESEAQRITGKEVKLSEMATVYAEYLAKAARFIEERGDSLFVEGSETNAIQRIWRQYGAVPLSAYSGVTAKDGRHNHPRMLDEMTAVLNTCKAADMWDGEAALSMLSIILDKYLGPRPKSFDFDGKTYEPVSFLKEALQIDPDAYVDFMSTLSFPFYKLSEFKVPDNWWHAETYRNAPLEEFYEAFKEAIKKGFSAAVAIDVSEPGNDGANDVMFIPDYDIPSSHIDQLSREYRFANEVTTDDHGVHVVGYTEHAGHDWFLAKDSGRSARRGKVEGYYFIRDDYIRLKMLAFTVHRDAAAELLKKF